MNPLLSHILRRGLRSVGENASLNLVSAGVIAAALTLGGAYAAAMLNLSRIVETWDRDVHISAYFAADVPVEARFALKDELAALPEVASVDYVSEADAQAWLTTRVEDVKPVLDELGPSVLPASLEITLAPGYTLAPDIAAFVGRLDRPELADVEYGQEWVQRFNAFLGLLQLIGLVLGLLIGTAAVFLVANTMHLVVYARRAELETMKLVGATWGFVSAPFAVEGAIQGLAGGGLALGAMVTLHRGLVLRLQEALQLGVGELQLTFLPGVWQAALVLVGVTLGVVGSLSAVRRFWSQAP